MSTNNSILGSIKFKVMPGLLHYSPAISIHQILLDLASRDLGKKIGTSMLNDYISEIMTHTAP